MRKTLFISHGDTVIDNEFTKWITLKLIALGYEVWCDLKFLDKGVDHWAAIEREIRENSIKVLPVLSVFSNRREGVLKELAVAEKVKKVLDDDAFIIPLMIDQNLSFDDINIEAVRLNAVNFRTSWAAGLRDLLEALEKQEVPCSSPNPELTSLLYQQIFLHDKGAIAEEEVYQSNWFPIISFPEELRFHEFPRRVIENRNSPGIKYPTARYGKYLATFAWEYDFIDEFPETSTYLSSWSVRIPMIDILTGTIKETNFIRPSECKRLVVDLLNQASARFMVEAGFRDYEMSNRLAYWIEKDTLERDKFNKVQLLGKDHENTWHYGVSPSAKLYPFPVFVFSSHIFFTTNGIDLIESDATQHSARRRLGKNWWNGKWRRLLMALIGYLGTNSSELKFDVGSEEQIVVGTEPVTFLAPATYKKPIKNTLSEEVEISNIGTVDEIDNALDDIPEPE